MRIAHTADVHIRALSRHDEYRHILKAFTDDCRSQKVDHIFVGGDIFHTKTTGISPEYIDLLTWWLNDMSKVAEVHLVLGNHDGNLVNLSRQDAVSPIVEAMSNPRVHLYKKSGVYPFAKGFNWCVFSCFDEEGWKDVKPVSGEINIAAYHGPVIGCSAETGWEIVDGVELSFFDEYDFAFLGDIHVQQFLSYRNGKPTIAYPGTPIQQGYAEKIDHGYFLWNIQNSSEWDVVPRSLPNLKPYVTINWEGNTDGAIESARKFPKESRFRIRSDIQITQGDAHRLSEFLKTSMSASEVAYKSDFQINPEVISAGAATIEKENVRTPESMMKLLKEYHRGTKLSDDDVVKLTEIVKKNLSDATDDDSSMGSKWSLRSLRWDNIFSYGEGNIVNFDGLNGIVGIFGPNRTGKSSIIGALMYALFNTTDRGSMKNIDVCNVRKDYCSAQAILDHNGTTYVIERQTAKTFTKKSGLIAPTNLNLFRMREDGKMDDLCGEQRIETERTIKSLFGSSEDFLLTSLSAQGEAHQFISHGPTRRRAILARFLDLDVFDKMHEIASKEVSSIKSQLKNYPDRDWNGTKEELQDSISSCKEQISDIESKISFNRTDLDDLRRALSDHGAAPVTEEEVESHKKRVASLEKKSNEIFARLLDLESESSSLEKKSKALSKLIEENDISALRAKLTAQRKLEESISNLMHAYEREHNAVNQHKKSLKLLDEVPCGDQFTDCKFIKDAHAAKKSISDQMDKERAAQEALSDARSALEKLKDDSLESRIEKAEKAKELLMKMSIESSKSKGEIERLKSEQRSTDATLKEARTRSSALEDALVSHENGEVVSLRRKIEAISADIKELDDKKMDIATQYGKHMSRLEKLQEEKSARDQLLADMRLHELVSNAFAKKGIPLLVTKSQLPIINSEILKILQGIVDFNIILQVDDDTDSLEVYIDYGDSRRIIELCSGMEKTIAAIAIRVAMINVSSLPKSNFFIIDEGFGTLDSAGVEACNRLLESLKRYFKSVIVITHVDGIKDSADFVLEITKNEKDSKLEHLQ